MALGSSRCSPLATIAAYAGHDAALGAILAQPCADANVTTSYPLHQTALLSACRSKPKRGSYDGLDRGRDRCVALLCSFNATHPAVVSGALSAIDLNYFPSDMACNQCPAVHKAAYYGAVERVDILLDAGAVTDYTRGNTTENVATNVRMQIENARSEAARATTESERERAMELEARWTVLLAKCA